MTSFASLIASNAFIAVPPRSLDRELHTFARHHDFERGRALVRFLLCFDRDPVERVVAPIRVVVVEDQTLHLRLGGDIDCARDRGVPHVGLKSLSWNWASWMSVSAP